MDGQIDRVILINQHGNGGGFFFWLGVGGLEFEDEDVERWMSICVFFWDLKSIVVDFFFLFFSTFLGHSTLFFSFFFGVGMVLVLGWVWVRDSYERVRTVRGEERRGRLCVCVCV